MGLTADIIPLPSARLMQCSSCGASASAACDCGVPYLPAGERAAKAIAENPEMSTRAIAAEIGVDHTTVVRAKKKAGGAHAPPAVKGKDGKNYPAKSTQKGRPRKAKKAPDAVVVTDTPCDDCNTDHERWQRSVMNMAGESISLPAYWTQQFGDWKSFPVSTDLIKLVHQAADIWKTLADELTRRKQ